MTIIGRRTLLLGTGALALAGCGKPGTGGAALTADDIAIGAENAPVTLIEYASVMCSHCKEFHDEAWDQLKANYIDTGKVRFVLREIAAPAAAATIAVAGFQVARCGGPSNEQYIDRVNTFYAKQPEIFSSGSMQAVIAKLVEIGAGFGLSENQVMTCIRDETGGARMNRVGEAALRDFQVTGTPTFILNGAKITDPPIPTYAQLAHLLDAAIAGG